MIVETALVFMFLALISNWLLIREIGKEVKALRNDNRRLKQRMNAVQRHPLADPIEVD